MSEKENVTIKVQLNSNDVYNFQKNNSWRAISLASKVDLCIGIAALAIITLISKTDIQQKATEISLLFVIPILIFSMSLVWLKLGANKTFINTKPMQKLNIYTLNKEGIESKSEAWQVFMKWKDFYQVIESKYGFHFYISKKQAYVIPKRCIDEKQLEVVRNLITRAPKPPKKSLFRLLVLENLTFLIALVVLLVYLVK